MQFDDLYNSYLGDLWVLSPRKFWKIRYRMTQFGSILSQYIEYKIQNVGILWSLLSIAMNYGAVQENFGKQDWKLCNLTAFILHI